MNGFNKNFFPRPEKANRSNERSAKSHAYLPRKAANGDGAAGRIRRASTGIRPAQRALEVLK
jgi:hypothetical protein